MGRANRLRSSRSQLEGPTSRVRIPPAPPIPRNRRRTPPWRRYRPRHARTAAGRARWKRQRSSATCGTACSRAMSCPPGSVQKRTAAPLPCSTMTTAPRAMSDPRWSRSFSASTGCMRPLHRRAARPGRRPPQGARRLRPQGTGNRSTAAPRLQYLRRDQRSGGRLGVLGRRCAALGVAQHLRRRRDLRRLRRREQLHDEAREEGSVTKAREPSPSAPIASSASRSR